MSAPVDNKLVAAPGGPAIVLTADEQRILLAFRAMDQQARDKYVWRMSQSAKRYPHRAAPVLHLVPGGAK